MSGFRTGTLSPRSGALTDHSYSFKARCEDESGKAKAGCPVSIALGSIEITLEISPDS